MTRRSLPYWHVDAFAAQPFTGNQAAVVIVENWPSDAQMLAIAAENMFAETAFLHAVANSAEADYELRWFAPAVEVALCGHATLASGHVLLGLDPARESVRFATRRSGLLAVRRCEGGYELALPAIRVVEEASPALVAGLQRAPEEALQNDNGYVICRYTDEAAVRALTPDMALLAQAGDTMFICTAPGEKTDIVSRVFVPGAGIPEDSVTGSAHAALTTYWSERLGRNSFTAHQASARGGDLTCRLDRERVILGGKCVTVVEGRFYLEG